jgi:hypothetical protein
MRTGRSSCFIGKSRGTEIKETGHDIKNKIYFIIFMILKFIGLLFLFGFTATRSLEAAHMDAASN